MLTKADCLGFRMFELRRVEYVVVWGGGVGWTASGGGRPVAITAIGGLHRCCLGKQPPERWKQPPGRFTVISSKFSSQC